MFVKASLLKLMNALGAVGGMSLFSYLTGEIEHLLFFLYFSASIIIAASIFDFGLNAVNSSVHLPDRHFFVPKLMKVFFAFRIDYLATIITTLTVGFILNTDAPIVLGILLCVHFRIFIMRWVTIERKDVSSASSILYGEIPLTVLNSVSIYLLIFSEFYFILAQFTGYLCIMVSLRKTRSFLTLWNFEKHRKISVSSEHDVGSLLQSYISAFKNNITGLLLGNVNNNSLETFFLANRLIQLFLVPYSGIVASIPRLLKLQDQKLGRAWLSIIMPPIIFITILVFFPALPIFIINSIYNSDVVTYNKLSILVLLMPALLSFLNIYLVSKNKQRVNIALDLLQLLMIGGLIKCAAL